MVNESITLNFKERDRVLRFGIGPTRILCEDRGISAADMQKIDLNELIQDIIVAALKFECLLTGSAVDFNKWEVYQWITDMEQETFQSIFDIFLKTRVIGKSIYDKYLKEVEKNSGIKAGEPADEKKNLPGTISMNLPQK